MMSAKYFEYYNIILRGAFFRGHTVFITLWCHLVKGNENDAKRLANWFSFSCF